jgi:hypothetical protein
MAAKKITAKSPGVVIELLREEEDQSPRDQFSEPEDVEFVEREIENGNPWAWFVAHVRVTYKGILSHDDYLGGCSYKNEKDFKKGGYYDDMVNNCLSEINKQLAALRK